MPIAVSLAETTAVRLQGCLGKPAGEARSLMQRFRKQLGVGAMLSAMVIGTIVGCGRSGVARYAVEGTVTFRGEPVMDGTVEFEPDADAGNSGPAAYGSIQDGRYTIPRSKGHVGGAYLIRTSGYEVSLGPAAGGPPPKTLFRDHVTRAELPKANTTLDIGVSENEGQGRVSRSPLNAQ